MTRKLFVTTALPYANGPFHIGHIMEYIQADIWVRFQRMRGNVVHFVCADDAHGAPIMLKAETEGISPQELVARVTADRPRYLQGFHIGFDHWYSTDSPENVALSQDIYRRLKAAGLVYVKAVQQFTAMMADLPYTRLRDADFTHPTFSEGLNFLFSNESTLLRTVRDIGLGLVDRAPPLKSLFIRQAAGLAGEVPRLLKGEAL